MFLLLAFGCSPDAPALPDPTTPPIGTAPLTATCAENPVIPAVQDCVFTSPAAGAGHVDVWLADAPEVIRSTPAGPIGTAHDVAVLGLKAGREYGWRAVVDSDGERAESPDGVFTVPSVPPEFPAFTLEVTDDRSETAEGYVMLAAAVLTSDRFTAHAILDGDGDYVWWSRTEQFGLGISPRFSRDGTSLRWLESDMRWESDIGVLRRLSLDGDESTETRALLGHHASWENADGTLTWLGFEYRTFDGVDWASDVLRTAPEGTPDGVDPTQEFSWFDAYPVDPFESVPGQDFVSLGDGVEWTHSNSLMALDDDHFYVMSKILDCLLKIDRSTGQIVWQLGGRYGDFTHPGGTSVWRSAVDNDLFSHSHMSHVWDGGLAVFDNADHTGKRTRAVVYDVDEDARTVEEVWSYVEPDELHTGSMGDVRLLDGGNYLIGWSSLGYISEVTPDGDVVWRVRMDLEGHIGRITPLTDLYAPPDAGLS